MEKVKGAQRKERGESNKNIYTFIGVSIWGYIDITYSYNNVRSVANFLTIVRVFLHGVLNRTQVSVIPCCSVPQEAEVEDGQGA